MKLDSVTAELRPRNAWEAADLGARLVRRDAAAIYKTWFATSLPVLALALCVVYFTPWPAFAIVVYWWFEPVLDGPILDIIARRLFGGDADVRATLRNTPKNAWRNRLFWLTPWRFHFARSTALPLTQLEGLSGAARRRRAKVLNNSILNHGIGVTAVYQHLVLVVYLGILMSIFLFIPAPYQDFDLIDAAGGFWVSESRHAEAMNLLLFYIAQSLLEPWYVGAGFGLYINCRTRLEAWDIEVAFRRMVARREPAPAAAVQTGVAIVAIVATVALAGAPASLRAEEQAPVAEDDPGFAGYWLDEDFDEELETVLAGDEFQEFRTEERWVSKTPRQREPGTSRKLGGMRNFFEQVGLFLSFLAEFGLWILAAVLIVVLYLSRDRWLPYLMVEQGSSQTRARVVLSTGEVTAAELPADIPGRVRELWSAGQHRAALSLLYRGSVFALVDRHGVRLPESATEGSCIAAVTRQASASQSEFFRAVVNAWIRLAYGSRLPSDETIQALTAEWASHYGEAGA